MNGCLELLSRRYLAVGYDVLNCLKIANLSMLYIQVWIFITHLYQDLN